MEHLNQLSLHRHTYIYLFLYKFFFHLCCYRISSRVACGYVVGPWWLSIIYIVVSIYMLIPNSQSSPRPNLPFGNHQLGFYVDVFLMFFGGGSLIIWSHATFLFLFCCLCFQCHIHKITSKTNVYNFSRMFSSPWFIVSDLAVKSLINSEISFLCGTR